MAGYGASWFLSSEGIRPTVYDKDSTFGGHTSSYTNPQGFTFDFGPHISFTQDSRIQEIFSGFVDEKFDSLQVKLNNYWQGLLLTHPVQLHLFGLPHDLIVEIVTGFLNQQSGDDPKVENYEDWLIASFGHKFATLFPMQYTRKYHTTSARNMTTDWLGPRMYRPKFEEMLRGALGPWSPDIHYVSHFRYPLEGGFATYLQRFPDMADIQLNHEVVRIDPANRQLHFANGKHAPYDGLVSSIPLPDLIPMIDGVPQDVASASQELACSTCVLVNVGVDRSDLSEAHMTYFYDEDICFSRISFPHMLASANAPEGYGSIQAEVYFSSKYRPLAQAPESVIDVAINDLKRSKILKDDDRILSREARVVRYANVIFDQDRSRALQMVHGYLDDERICYCGRYGDWDYMWTDQSFVSGENAAQKALSLI
jgi:protoporphyrinogen oxidase